MPEEHQILVDPIVVNLVPVQVENVDKPFEPCFFMLVTVQFIKNDRYFLATRLLVLWFIRVIHHYMNLEK